MTAPIRVIIAGLQTFTDYDALKQYCDHALQQRDNVEILAPTQKGTGAMGMKYAKERGHGLKVYPVDFTAWGGAAITMCYKEMVKHADAVIVFWDGNGKTLATLIKMAKDRGLKVRESVYSKPAKPAKQPKVKQTAIPLSDKCRQRYIAAHQRYQKENTPNAVKDFGFVNTQIPKINTANGLTTFIVKYLDWMGYYGNRINTVGREINQKYTDGHGKVHVTKKWITGTTKKGSADVSAIINGRACSFEVKIGADKASEDQLKQKSKIERAGGIYEFVSSPEEFFNAIDSISSPS